MSGHRRGGGGGGGSDLCDCAKDACVSKYMKSMAVRGEWDKVLKKARAHHVWLIKPYSFMPRERLPRVTGLRVLRLYMDDSCAVALIEQLLDVFSETDMQQYHKVGIALALNDLVFVEMNSHSRFHITCPHGSLPSGNAVLSERVSVRVLEVLCAHERFDVNFDWSLLNTCASHDHVDMDAAIKMYEKVPISWDNYFGYSKRRYRTLMNTATFFGNVFGVHFLLTNSHCSARLGKAPHEETPLTPPGRQPILHLAYKLYASCLPEYAKRKADHKRVLFLLLESGKCDVHALDHSGRNILFCPLYSNSSEEAANVFEHLITHYNVDVNCKSDDRMVPLTHLEGDYRAVEKRFEILLRRGAFPFLPETNFRTFRTRKAIFHNDYDFYSSTSSDHNALCFVACRLQKFARIRVFLASRSSLASLAYFVLFRYDVRMRACRRTTSPLDFCDIDKSSRADEKMNRNRDRVPRVIHINMRARLNAVLFHDDDDDYIGR